MALQLKNTIFRDSKVILCISDHSNNSYEVSKQIQSNNIFYKCCFIKTKEIINKVDFPSLADSICIGLGINNRISSQVKDLMHEDIDEIVCYNTTIDIDAFLSLLYKQNRDIRISFLEEGLLNYENTFRMSTRRSVIKAIKRITRKPYVNDVLKNFYCLYPGIYKGELNTVKIPNICRTSQTAKDLRIIFQLDGKNLSYKQRYIFFTSVLDFVGGKPIGEFEVAQKIADLVGKDNLLIKLHPRDTRTIYRENGFAIDENSNIPWEAIQLTMDFSDKIFLSTTSGSVLSGRTMSDSPVKTYYMYKFCHVDENQYAKRSIGTLEELLSRDDIKLNFQNVFIANSMEDIL